MGKPAKKPIKIKAKKRNYKPIDADTVAKAIEDASKIPSENGTEYQKFIHTHLMAVCAEILEENRSEVMKRASERINAIQAMQSHK